MRIFGGHDYYDSALAYGRDETLVFERRPEGSAEVVPYGLCGLAKERLGFAFERSRREGWSRNGEIERGHWRYVIEPMAVWFAGRRYGGAVVYASSLRLPLHNEVLHFWDLGKFRSYLHSVDIEFAPPSRWRQRDHIVDGDHVARHFSREPAAAETDWLIESRTSIAVWHGAGKKPGWKVDVDGLGKIGFASRLDPFTAFQELSMWIGGVLPREANPTVEIHDDRTKVRKHGMDEWSFRRMPGT